MARILVLAGCLSASLAVAACNGGQLAPADAASPQDVVSLDAGVDSAGAYTNSIDFAPGSLEPRGDGTFVIFTLAASTQRSAPSPAQGIVESADQTSCAAGLADSHRSYLVSESQQITTGKALTLTRFDVEIVPTAAFVLPDGGLYGKVCYGYRSPDGNWHLDMTPHPLILDTVTKTYHIYLDISPVQADEGTLLFDMNQVAVRRILYAATP